MSIFNPELPSPQPDAQASKSHQDIDSTKSIDQLFLNKLAGVCRLSAKTLSWFCDQPYLTKVTFLRVGADIVVSSQVDSHSGLEFEYKRHNHNVDFSNLAPDMVDGGFIELERDQNGFPVIMISGSSITANFHNGNFTKQSPVARSTTLGVIESLLEQKSGNGVGVVDYKNTGRLKELGLAF